MIVVQMILFLAPFAIVAAIVVVVPAVVCYNKLQCGAQNVKEKSSNVQISLSKKIAEINQLAGFVKGYQEFEQFTHLKISTDTDPSGLASAYTKSNQTMLAIQSAAQRFPDLKANTQYAWLMDSIKKCESNIQQNRMIYNTAVKEYNNACLSVPTVLFSRTLGFLPAPYLEFDSSGLPPDNALHSFKTDDGERLNALLGQAGNVISQAGHEFVSKASPFCGNTPNRDRVKDKSQQCVECGVLLTKEDKFCSDCGKSTSRQE
jgi:LemA protein